MSRTKPELGELLRHHVAEAFDIHRAARREVAHALVDLRRARRVRAARHRFTRRMIDVRSADRAAVGHFEAAHFLGALGENRADDARNHVAGARDEHGIADADVVALDIVGVVQRRALDRHAADRDRFQHGVGIERSGAPDADHDVEKLRTRLARLELKGDRPTRIARDDAEPLLQREIVDLDDDAVDLVVELVALRLPRTAVLDDVFQRRGARRCWDSPGVRGPRGDAATPTACAPAARLRLRRADTRRTRAAAAR